MTLTFRRMLAHRLSLLAMAASLVAVACSSSPASALPTINVSALPGASTSPATSPAASAASSMDASASGNPAGSAATGSAAAGSPPALGSCPKSQPAPMPAGQTANVTINTNQGAIVIKVEGALGPNAAGNFVALAKCGYYDGVVFHRVVPGFVIQGGDGQYGRVPNVGLDVGSGGPGYSFPDDPVTTTYTRGTVAMANAGPNTNGSQFFIVLADAGLPPNYSVFGHVTSGMDAVDKIAALPTDGDANGNHPLQSVPMTSVTVITP